MSVPLLALCLCDTVSTMNAVRLLKRRESDLEVNPVREKKLTNVRAAGADEKGAWPESRLALEEAALGSALPREMRKALRCAAALQCCPSAGSA